MSSVTALLDPVKEWVGADKPKISSIVFSLTTKVTVVLILVFSLLVTASTYFGDPIDCIVEEVPSGVIDTYCWIHSTFTLPQRIIAGDSHNPVDNGNSHPGVGAPEYEEVTTTHSYYQWVCFTLVFQAGIFFAPKWLWNVWEGGKLKGLISSELVYYPSKDSPIVTDLRMPGFTKPRGILSDDTIDQQVNRIRNYLVKFYGRPGVYRHKRYLARFLLCEVFCFFTIIFNIAFIDIFLGGMFSTYGNMVWEISNMDPADRRDPMNLVFPKVAKCNFYRQGPSGTMQNRDALCVLPVNIFNEKIYIFLWFWLINLVWFISLCLIYRWASLLLPSLMAWELKAVTHNLIDTSLANRLVRTCRRGEVFFLIQLGRNLDPYIFAKLCKELDKSLTSRNEQMSDGSVPNGTPTQTESIYPALTSPTAAEKEAEAAAAVEAAIEAAAERIEMQEMNMAKNNEYLKYNKENSDS